MSSRIKNLRSILRKKNIGAFLITKDVDIRYLTGFPASESWLFVLKSKVFYITDFRYILEAKNKLNKLKGIAVKQYTQSIQSTLFDLASKLKVQSLGFDERHLSLLEYKALKKKTPKTIRLKPANGLVDSLREVKDDNEISKIKKALKIHQEALLYIKKYIRSNITERQILQRLEQFVKEKEADFSFDPIVASGPNSSYPHAVVSRRKIRDNEPVLLDMGIDYEGYKSDLTRMFYLGKIPKLVQAVHDAVYAAQQRAISKIKAGVPVALIDREARNYLKSKKLDKYFGHALGHGVGLEIHETPRLSQASKAVLKEGMIVTVEPAVYIPQKFGIRLEEMVLVTKKGCAVLSGHID